MCCVSIIIAIARAIDQFRPVSVWVRGCSRWRCSAIPVDRGTITTAPNQFPLPGAEFSRGQFNEEHLTEEDLSLGSSSQSPSREFEYESSRIIYNT